MTVPAHLPSSGPIGKLFHIGQGMRNLLASDGLDSGQKMRDTIFEITNGAEFGKTRIPSIVTPPICIPGKMIIMSSGPLADGIRASASFPGVFSPIKKDDMLLADGFLFHIRRFGSPARRVSDTFLRCTWIRPMKSTETGSRRRQTSF
jgi:predicted acylesterase/phospholipase RssA